MSQATFTGETIPLHRPQQPLNNSHRIVLGVFNGADELTYADIQNRLQYRIKKGDIQETANRARELTLSGHLEKFTGRDGKTRFRLPRRTSP